MKTTDGRDKVIKNKKTGECFIETSKSFWVSRFDMWIHNQDKCVAATLPNEDVPCPMPKGHQMFKYPDAYGCGPLNYGN